MANLRLRVLDQALSRYSMDYDIIKLGGTIITSASAPDLFDHDTVARIARELAGRSRGCILLHGTGLYCKPHAREHGYVTAGKLPSDARGIALAKRLELRQLNQIVAGHMIGESVPAFPQDNLTYFPPSMDGFRSAEALGALRHYLAGGLVPIFYGDLMPQRDGSFSVFSSDTIALLLARALTPRRVIFLSATDGVFDTSGATLSTLGPSNLNAMGRIGGDGDDVSGGMAEKVALSMEIARHCGSCTIADGYKEGVLTRLLDGEEGIGTRILST